VKRPFAIRYSLLAASVRYSLFAIRYSLLVAVLCVLCGSAATAVGEEAVSPAEVRMLRDAVDRQAQEIRDMKLLLAELRAENSRLRATTQPAATQPAADPTSEAKATLEAVERRRLERDRDSLREQIEAADKAVAYAKAQRITPGINSSTSYASTAHRDAAVDAAVAHKARLTMQLAELEKRLGEDQTRP
jgi:hypothetical protein